MTKDFIYDWTPEQREEFERKEKERNEQLRHYYLYQEFIENTSEAFLEKRRVLMSLIENGVNKGRINKKVRMMSRIKSNKSVYENKMKKKKLDDIFATTILAETKEELEYIYHLIENSDQIEIVRKKKLNKAKFVAEHLYLVFKQDGNVVECRLQTEEHFEHAYSHTLYKENGDKELTEEQIKSIEEKKQKMYNSGSASIYSEIPLKWKAEFDAVSGKMHEKQLSINEVLKELYPFLKLREEEIEK